MPQHQNLPAFLTKGVATKALLKSRKKAAKAKRQVVSRRGDDYGTPELHKKHMVVEEVRERLSTGQPVTKGARVMDQLPIDRYYQRHELAPKPDDPHGLRNAALYRAAMKLRDDFYQSGLMARGRTVLERAPSGTTAPDRAMLLHVSSLTAFNKAVTAMSPSLRPILRAVVCYDQTARDWAVENRDNPNGGLAMLRAALTDLARYYRFMDC